MAKKKNKTPLEDSPTKLLFGKKNYIFMGIGLFFIFLGFVLMSGGGSDNPQIWNQAIFNFRRIRLAPMLVLLGFGIEIYAILLDSDKK